MWLGRKEKNGSSGQRDQWAHRFAGAIIKMQQQLSDVISIRLKALPVNRLKLLLVAFCLVGSGMSVYLLTSTLNNSKRMKQLIPIDQMQKPMNTQKIEKVLLQQSSDGTDEFNHILNIKSYLDSLRNDFKGKKLYDGLLSARPFLMDSIRQLEAIYIQQYKK